MFFKKWAIVDSFTVYFYYNLCEKMSIVYPVPGFESTTS